MAGYTRQSSFADGDIIQASDFNDEYNQLVNVFDNTTGHSHDGTSGEGPVIGLIGDPGVAAPINKVVVDDTNNRVGVFVDAGGLGSSVEQVRFEDGAVLPVTTNDIDLGSSLLEYKDGYFAGSLTVGGVSVGGGASIGTILDEDNMISDDDTALATQQSIKAYVDAQVTAQDLDFQADTGGALNVDLDSQTLTLTGGTGIDTVGSGQAVTFAIDSTVATLSDSQTLINKIIDAANNTISNINTTHLESGVLDTDLTSVSASDDTLASAKAIKTYVDAQVTAQDLDFQGDSGGALNIDLDSETLTFTGGTGIDTSGAGNAVTFAIDSTVTTLTGTQTLTNKTLTSAVLDGTISGTSIKDEDTMVSDSDTHLATQQSIKAYVDAQVGAIPLGDITEVTAGTGLSGGGTSGAVTLDIDSTVATLTGTQTLTNKTLTSAVLDTGVSGTAILDEDTMSSDSDTQLATQQSIKAYVDAQVGAGSGLADIVDDTTPQLGGTLDTNGQLIQFGDSSGATDDRLQLGDSQDMQLYHDGTNNKIDTAASQELHVNSDDVLFYDNSGTTRTAIVSPGSTMNFQLYDSTGTVRVFAVNGSGNEFHRSVYIQDQRSLGFKEDSANGTNYVAFQAPASVAANVTWTLPDADGTSGQFLQTDGSGALSWADEADGSALAFAIALG